MRSMKRINISQNRAERLMTVKSDSRLGKIDLEIFYPHIGISLTAFTASSIEILANARKEDLIFMDSNIFNFRETKPVPFYPGTILYVRNDGEILTTVELSKSPLGSKIYTIETLGCSEVILDTV